MGSLVAIEGLDGAGKRTVTDGLAAALRERGNTVTRLAFPRYEHDVHAALIRQALRGEHGDLADSVYGMAMLFALDRRDATSELAGACRGYDVVLVDRYIASNAAYGAARLRQDVDGEFVSWLRGLELAQFGVPAPDLQLLLRVTPELAAGRAQARAVQDAERVKDAFESDASLQQRCAARYDQLVERGWLAPWLVADGTAVESTQLAEKLAAALTG